VEPVPGHLPGPPPAARPADPDRASRGGHHDDALLRLGGAPRTRDTTPPVDASRDDPAWLGGGRGSSDGSTWRPEPVEVGPPADVRPSGDGRPFGDGADDWTVPMSVVPPAPAPEAARDRPRDDLWAGDSWAAEARRAARTARAAERPPEPDPVPGHRRDDGPRHDPTPARHTRYRPAHQRPAHHRPAHERSAHERSADERAGDGPAVDVPAARVAPLPPAWAHRRDDRADHRADDRAYPSDERSSGRHRRPDR
jgi:hypothetical protein